MTSSGTPAGVLNDPAVAVVRLLLRHFHAIALAAMLGGGIAIAISFLLHPAYRAYVTILPSLGSQDSSLLAAYGNLVNLPVKGAVTIEDLYPAIVKSDAVLDRIIENDAAIFGPETSLFDILGVKASDRDSTIAPRTLKKVLREQVLSCDQDQKTGLLTLSALLPGPPSMAAKLVNSIADSLGSFVEVFSISKTRHQLRYIQRRIDEVSNELEIAEADLAAFRTENRVVINSPKLRMIDGRKERHAQALKEVWIELVRQLEIAKVDDNKERYEIDILDRALPPLHKATPRRAVMGLVGFILGTLSMCIFVVVRQFPRNSPNGQE